MQPTPDKSMTKELPGETQNTTYLQQVNVNLFSGETKKADVLHQVTDKIITQIPGESHLHAISHMH